MIFVCIDSLENEEWKLVNFPNVKENSYFISSKGRIYSTIKNSYIQPTNHIQGYLHITVKSDTIGYKKILMHRLVAWHFVDGLSEVNKFVNHIDGNKKNNDCTNLEWTSHIKNVQHAFKNSLNNCSELFKTKYVGEGNPSVKYTDSMVHEICTLLTLGLSTADTVNVFLEKYPHLSKKSVYSYVKTKIKPRLSRHLVTEQYNF